MAGEGVRLIGGTVVAAAALLVFALVAHPSTSPQSDKPTSGVPTATTPAQPQTFTIAGEVILADRFVGPHHSSGACHGVGKYRQLFGIMRVTVRTSLSGGTVRRAMTAPGQYSTYISFSDSVTRGCVFTFFMSDVPLGSPSYFVQIGSVPPSEIDPLAITSSPFQLRIDR